MALVGTLSTMALSDLLQWLGAAAKTGTLQVQQNEVTKVIRLRQGRVVGCSSNSMAQRLGQFLLSRGKINGEQLKEALAAQQEAEAPPRRLGSILVEMGAIAAEDLIPQLEAKAEEIIYSLFDWDEGTFRFETTLDEVEDSFSVDLLVEDIMLRGLKRHDEMARIREVFHDTHLVLRYTSTPPGPEIFGDEKSRSMYAAIDGERSIADILLHIPGSDFSIQQFLFGLHQKNYVEIAGSKSIETHDEPESTPPAAAEPTDATVGAPPPMPDLSTEAELTLDAAFAEAKAPAAAAAPVACASVAIGGRPTAVAVAETVGGKPTAAAVATVDAREAESRLASARRLMAEGKYEEALDILDALHGQRPDDDALCRLKAEAEAAFVERSYRHSVPAKKVPVLTQPMESLSADSLTPQEWFMLSRIDGSWDVRSIIQVAPFREVEALRTLKRMREMGMIELIDAV